jgi:uncharacterized protein YbjT (DUF2867 family)
MRIIIFGANGPTGRLLTAQSLAAGHETVAVTRRPEDFPLHDPLLRVAGADALDPVAVGQVLQGGDAVLSALGTPFTKSPIEVYSRGVANLLDGMRHAGVARLVVVSSSAVVAQDEPTGGFLFNRVLQPYLTKRIGRTTYDDLRRMEALVQERLADWTILRASGLFDLPAVTGYSLTEGHGPGRFTARVDLADAMLRQVTDDAFSGRIGHVITTEGNPTLLSLVMHEALKR